jgi:hypothetical protein
VKRQKIEIQRLSDGGLVVHGEVDDWVESLDLNTEHPA